MLKQLYWKSHINKILLFLLIIVSGCLLLLIFKMYLNKPLNVLISEFSCNETESVAKAKNTVVKIITEDGSGSGFLISKGEYIVTNNHVVEGIKNVQLIMPDGLRIKGIVINGDNEVDIAIIKPSTKGQEFLEWSNLKNTKSGDTLIAVGFPLSTEEPLKGEATVTKGAFSAKRTNQRGTDYIQTDTAINPGNSGGPLIDKCGMVVGVNVFIIREDGAEGLNYAISANSASSVASKLINNPTDTPPSGTLPAFGEDLDPVDIVKNYYYLLSSKDLIYAYDLYATKYQKETSFEEWIQLWNDVSSIEINKIEEIQHDPPKVKAEITVIEYDGLNTLQHENEVIWGFEYNHGRRKIKMDKFEEKKTSAVYNKSSLPEFKSSFNNTSAYFNKVLERDFSKYNQSQVEKLKNLISKYKKIANNFIEKVDSDKPLSENEWNEIDTLDDLYKEISDILDEFNKKDWQDYWDYYYSN